jgi:hypothetical protein
VALANALGRKLIDAGFSGHINSESGHGPSPDGLLQFAAFLKTLLGCSPGFASLVEGLPGAVAPESDKTSYTQKQRTISSVLGSIPIIHAASMLLVDRSDRRIPVETRGHFLQEASAICMQCVLVRHLAYLGVHILLQASLLILTSSGKGVAAWNLKQAKSNLPSRSQVSESRSRRAFHLMWLGK